MNLRRSLPALLVVPIVLSVACDDKKSSAPPPATTASAAPPASATASASPAPSATPSATAALPDKQPLVLHFRAGPAALFFDQAQELELDEAARAGIEKLSDQLDADEDDSPRLDTKGLHDDVVAAVRAGSVDAKALGARVTALQGEVQKRLDKEATAMNALWAALTPENRKTVAAGAQKRAKDREEDFARTGSGDAGTDSLNERSKHLQERLKRELDLDAAQTDKLTPILAKLPAEADAREAARKRFDGLVTAFGAATFDGKKLDAFGPAAAKARVPMDREVAFLAQLAPILTTEQREALAGRLEGERLRLGTGSPSARIKDWPFPFELEPGDIVSGIGGVKPRGKGPKGTAPPGSKPIPPHAKGE
jgi:Spy/CpxP family protein refolding chaperone